MHTPSDSYEDVAATYIQLVRKTSLGAGLAVAEIQTMCGARAAVFAALIITVLKMQAEGNERIQDDHLVAFFLKDYPQALPLLNHAVTCCGQTWGIADAPLIYTRPLRTPKAGTRSAPEPSGFPADGSN